MQQFGDPSEVLIRLGAQPTEAAVQEAVTRVRTALEKSVPGVKVLRTDAVGASVSAELFRNGLLALGISLVMILVYIWFRFEWQFAVGAVVTLILDITKAIGFLALTRIEFDLVMVAAILTILGYSTNDKVVVYDRVRENLRKYKTLPLRDLIDLSINETLNRTLGTSMTVFLASLPLALFGGEFDLRLRLGHVVRHHRRHLVFDLHRSAYPVVPGRDIACGARPLLRPRRWRARDQAPRLLAGATALAFALNCPCRGEPDPSGRCQARFFARIRWPAPSSPCSPASCPTRTFWSAIFTAMQALPRCRRWPRRSRTARPLAGSSRRRCPRAWSTAGPTT